MSNRFASRYLWPMVVFLLITAASAAFSRLDISWNSWAPAPCMPGACFCERVREGTVVQPVNAYTNLSFVLVGLLIIGTASSAAVNIQETRVPIIRSSPAYPWVYGISIVIIGVGSLFYHASLTWTGQWFDLMGMYMLAGFMILYNLARLENSHPAHAGGKRAGGRKAGVHYDTPGTASRFSSGRGFAATYIVMMAALGLMIAISPVGEREVFGIMIVIALLLEVYIQLSRRPVIKTAYFWAGVGLFAAAYGIWILDISGVLCQPDSWFQGHAVWHLLSAIAAGMIYKYYRSEKVDG